MIISSSGLRKSVKYSQNFINNSSLVKSFIQKSSISKNDIVYEIGPGTGTITYELAKLCKKVIAVEIDKNLAQKLKEKFHAVSNIEVRNEDFLTHAVGEKAYKVFSNIPFNITASIVKKLTELNSPPLDAFLFIQFEAAEKFVGEPIAKETQQSLLIKPFFELSVEHQFRRTDFRPMPNVDVALLRIKKRARPLVEAKNIQLYKDFIVYGFNSRKPVLREGFKNVFTGYQFSRLAKDLNFPDSSKPTDLNFSQWLSLFDFFLEGTDESKKLLVRDSESGLKSRQDKLKKIHRTRTAKNWRNF
ncbi:MAG: rRNA (Adenine-N(6)-)-methyltransferase [Parcubacteria group bacterium GW2011_GWC1_45_9]|nr:MAG: rRNA (Adenine-N(6)-)-methyltransferase [Parcubacteria group bacterium GW2011_GWB1_45_10]KKU17391.1 MAG: rRNA (Adenine-N(6)-)-methyltransferase [Parcubacteria group bacterium GW2011_GWC1_45_9]HCI05367.1 23S ribosomal RNA methyltransferase Erm [Patescibacteria group bacterium]